MYRIFCLLFALTSNIQNLFGMELANTLNTSGESLVSKMIAIKIVENKKGELDKELYSLLFSKKNIDNLENYIDAQHLLMAKRFCTGVTDDTALTHITFLDLSNNKLDTLPVELKELSNIEHFDGSHNRFKEIPEAVGYWFERLNTLNMSHNQLQCIERIGKEPLSNFKKLNWLTLTHNPILELPSEEIYELYLEQQEKKGLIWIFISKKYPLSDELRSVRDQVFFEINEEKNEEM